jgi:FecR protein
MDQISQVISAYLDGELDDEGIVNLAADLRGAPAVVDQLVLDMFVHSQLHHWMNVRQFRDDFLFDALGGMRPSDCSLDLFEDGVPAEAAVQHPAKVSPVAVPYRMRRQSWQNMVAALATALLIGVSIYTAHLVSSRHSIVAQLTRSDGCQWDNSAASMPVGTLLHQGQQLKLQSGRALVTFACGAQMMIEGPTTVEIASESKADLTRGRVGAKVPTQAIGFTITTPAADFVDLGTEFTLTFAANNQCELQVFDGLVEMRLLEPNGTSSQQRLRISEGSAVRFDAARRDVASIPYNIEQRIVP